MVSPVNNQFIQAQSVNTVDPDVAKFEKDPAFKDFRNAVNAVSKASPTDFADAQTFNHNIDIVDTYDPEEKGKLAQWGGWNDYNFVEGATIEPEPGHLNLIDWKEDFASHLQNGNLQPADLDHFNVLLKQLELTLAEVSAGKAKFSDAMTQWANIQNDPRYTGFLNYGLAIHDCDTANKTLKADVNDFIANYANS